MEIEEWWQGVSERHKNICRPLISGRKRLTKEDEVLLLKCMEMDGIRFLLLVLGHQFLVLIDKEKKTVYPFHLSGDCEKAYKAEQLSKILFSYKVEPLVTCCVRKKLVKNFKQKDKSIVLCSLWTMFVFENKLTGKENSIERFKEFIKMKGEINAVEIVNELLAIV